MQYNAGTSNGSANSEAHIYLLDTAVKHEHLLATNSASTWQPSAISLVWPWSWWAKLSNVLYIVSRCLAGFVCFHTS